MQWSKTQTLTQATIEPSTTDGANSFAGPSYFSIQLPGNVLIAAGFFNSTPLYINHEGLGVSSGVNTPITGATLTVQTVSRSCVTVTGQKVANMKISRCKPIIIIISVILLATPALSQGFNGPSALACP